MEEELLRIICAEYRKITGLSEVRTDEVLPVRHIDCLRERLVMNHNFKIMKKACKSCSLNDFAQAVKAACDFFDDLVQQTTEVAKNIRGRSYAPEDILFADCSTEESCIYKYKLCQILFARHKIDFTGTTKDLNTARDVAECIFANL